jgi:hypothetical protein
LQALFPTFNSSGDSGSSLFEQRRQELCIVACVGQLNWTGILQITTAGINVNVVYLNSNNLSIFLYFSLFHLLPVLWLLLGDFGLLILVLKTQMTGKFRATKFNIFG